MSQMEVRISHIFREGNKVEDALANKVVEHKEDIWISEHQLPPDVRGLIRVDRMGLPSFRFH